MANLKSDLDEYLLKNESRRSYKITLPFSKPSFLVGKSEDNSVNSENWYSDVQKDYCSLSRTQRFVGFAVCICFGILCFILSAFYIPLLVFKARKFVLLFTLGSLFFIFSFSFLYGPWAHIKSLFSKERALNSILYGSTLLATIYCALHLQVTILTIICAVAQVFTLLWMFMGSVPGGTSGMRFFGSMFKSSVSNTLPI